MVEPHDELGDEATHAVRVDRPQLDVVLPVYAEAATLPDVLQEVCHVLSNRYVVRLLVASDGGADGTDRVLDDLAKALPIERIGAARRRGYSESVRQGLGLARTELVLAMDADGQCDPRDAERLLEHAATSRADVVVGSRSPRCDPAVRRLLSQGFHALHRRAFGPTVSDPSCPLVVLRKTAIASALGGRSHLPSGLWWEVAARAKAASLRVDELPIRHRERRAGGSRAIAWSAVPRLALVHALGLVRLARELRFTTSQGTVTPT